MTGNEGGRIWGLERDTLSSYLTVLNLWILRHIQVKRRADWTLSGECVEARIEQINSYHHSL